MKNPFHRFNTIGGVKIDVNMSAVRGFQEEGQGTRITFTDGTFINVVESPRSVRGATRKTWPADTANEGEEA